MRPALPSEKDSSASTNRDDELQKTTDKKSELTGGITKNGRNISDSVQNLEGYTKQAVLDYQTDAKALKDYGKRIGANSVKSMDEVTKGAKATISSALSYFHIYLAVVAGTLIAIGVIGEYFFATYLPANIWNFLILWSLLTAVILVILWYLPKSLSTNELESKLSDETRKIVDVAGSYPQPAHDLTPLERFTTAAKNAIKGLVDNTLELIPVMNTIIEQQSKKLKQQRFVEDFVFAVQRYGIDATQEAQDIMITKSWLHDDEKTWLKDVSEVMSLIFSTDYRIFQLMYYEFFDDKYASQLWTELQKNGKTRRQLSQILVERKLIPTPETEKSIDIVDDLLEKLPTFNLEEIRSRATVFFSELHKFKESCKSHLDFYGLRIIEKADLLTRFVPPSPDIDSWRKDVMSFIAADILSKRPIDIQLLILSAEGDQETKKIWTEIIESGKLDELSSILSLKRIRPAYSEFRDVFKSHLQLSMKQNKDEFSLAKIETSVESLEGKILSTKHRIQHTASEFRLGSVNLDFVGSFVPSDPLSIETEIIEIVAHNLSVDYEIFSLLYHSANGLDGAQQKYEDLTKTPKIDQLAALLIARSFITKSKFNVNTVILLKTQPTLNLNSFVSAYIRYETLSERLDAFYPFLGINGILNRLIPLEMQEILATCPVQVNEPTENQLMHLALKITGWTFEETQLDDAQHYDLALASTAMFLRTYGYSGHSSLCQEASRSPFAIKVLFQYITIAAEQRLSGSRETMKNAVLQAVQGVVSDTTFDYFKSELSAGNLVPSADFLLLKFNQEVRKEYKDLQTKGFETQILDNYLDPIKLLLYESINETVVREFLLNQVLSAYLLTVPGGVAGITFVRDYFDYIVKAENQLASEKADNSYVNMVQLQTGGGKATRIGLVPLELTFEDFSSKFDQVWKRAVHLRNKDENISKSLPCFIIRIFPSEDGLKEIMPIQGVGSKPLEIIRELIRDSSTIDNSVSLLSLIQKAPNGRSALIKAIQGIFDSKKSSLRLMVADHSGILNKSLDLTSKFERKEIDRNLMKVYEVDLISQLGKKIEEQVLHSGEIVARKEFFEHIEKAFENNNEITPEEKERLMQAIFARLQSIGIACLI